MCLLFFSSSTQFNYLARVSFSVESLESRIFLPEGCFSWGCSGTGGRVVFDPDRGISPFGETNDQFGRGSFVFIPGHFVSVVPIG